VRSAEKLVRRGELEAAAKVYESVAANRYSVAVKRLGPLYAKLGWHQKARRFYEKAVRRRPNDAWAWHCLGYAFRRTSQLERAAEAYRKAYDIDSSDPSPLYGLGLTLEAMGRKRTAAEAFRKYARVETRKWAAGWVSRAKKAAARLSPTEREPAKEARRVARKPRPAVPAALLAARRAESSDDISRAEQLYREAVAKHPTMAATNRALVEHLLRQGKKKQAAIALKMGLRRVPRFVWARARLARILVGEGDIEGARFHIDIALKDDPDHPAGYCGKAMILRSDQPEEAWQHAIKGLRLARAGSHDKGMVAKCHELAVSLASELGKTMPSGLEQRREKRSDRATRRARPPVRPSSPRARPSRPADPHRAKAARVGPEVRPTAPKGSGPSKKPLPAPLRPARAKLEGGDASGARKIAAAYLKSHPGSFHARVLLAEALLKSFGDLNRAKRIARKAAAQDPAAAAPQRLLGLIALKFRRRSEARTHFESFLRLAADEPWERKQMPFIKGLLDNLS
jgi:tetratricopeptide (TPR) repeat protein